MKGGFRHPTREAVDHVAANLRAADLAELRALHGDEVDVRRVLYRAVHSSTLARVGHAPDGGIVSVIGVAPVSLLGGIGTPWMLATEQVFDFPLAFVREGRKITEQMLAIYPSLINYVDARNTASIRWLKHLGYKVHEAEPYGPQKTPFRRFEMHAEPVRLPADLSDTVTKTKTD